MPRAHRLRNALIGCGFPSLLIGCATFSGLSAQEAAPLVLQLPASTEALGLGNVFPVSGRDADAVFYNAGALVAARGIGLAGQRFAPGSTLVGASAALPWLGGGVGLGIQSLAYDATSDSLPPTLSDLVTDGEVAVAEMVASLGYARELGPIDLGVVGKVVEERWGGVRASAFAADLGATAEVAFFTLGLAVQNIGSDLSFAGVDLAMPERVAVSGSFEPEPLGPLDIRAAAAIARRSDGEIIPAGGLDVRFWPVQGRTFIGRVGLQRVPEGPSQPLSFGLAFWGDSFAVEYGFQSFEGPHDAHRLGVRWRQ